MCGRYSIVLTAAGWRDRFDVEPPQSWLPQAEIFPGQGAPIIVDREKPKVTMAWWGFRPGWAKETMRDQINARAETLATKPFFRDAFRHGRVLVPADAFYEWAGEGKTRRPYRIARVDGRPFAMAGIAAPRPEKPDVLGFAIVTTAAGVPVDRIHDRSPVILPPGHERDWLNPDLSTQEAAVLLQERTDAGWRMEPITLDHRGNKRNIVQTRLKPVS